MAVDAANVPEGPLGLAVLLTVLPLLRLTDSEAPVPVKRRWKVERTNAWLHSYRRAVTRYEKSVSRYEGFVSLACAFICLGKLE